ncbi:MAG: hypothetical protein NTZ33_13860 [Bacteroidetes bacterium]|nr:hypothetical protein [Bacteroidota bacterium]
MNWDFNSSEYSWKDIEVILLGRSISRILEIKYKGSQETKEIYGKGSEPQAIAKGNKKYEGDIKIGQSELEAMIDKVKVITGSSDPLDLPPFNISVAYVKNGMIRTDVCIGVVLKDVEKALKQGDTDMEVSVPFSCVKIKYNTTS